MSRSGAEAMAQGEGHRARAMYAVPFLEKAAVTPKSWTTMGAAMRREIAKH